MEANKQNKPSEKKPEQVKAPPKPKEPKKLPVNQNDYKEFTDLFFLKDSGAKLKVEKLKILKELKEKIQGCSGKIAKRTVTAAIGSGKTRIVEGLPVPKEIEEFLNTSKNPSHYI